MTFYLYWEFWATTYRCNVLGFGASLKTRLYINLKKCFFHQKKIYFIEFGVLAQRINIKKEKIEIVKARPEPQSIKDIQVLLTFANYWYFIEGFSKIMAFLTLILKTTFTVSVRLISKTANLYIFFTLKPS